MFGFKPKVKVKVRPVTQATFDVTRRIQRYTLGCPIPTEDYVYVLKRRAGR